MFDEGDIVACLNTEHSEQLQSVSGQDLRHCTAEKPLRDLQDCGLMGPPLRVRVNLTKDT